MAFAALKKYVEKIATDSAAKFSKVTDNAQFMRVVYACYLTGLASGGYDSKEKEATMKVINKHFPQFSLSDIRTFIDAADAEIDFDLESGKLELLRVISGARDNADNASMIVQAAVMVGNADGDFDQDEMAVVRLIATRLDLNPQDYGLVT